MASKRALPPVLCLLLLGIAACSEEPEPEPEGIGRDERLPEAPPPEPLPDEPTIAHGVAKEERVFVRVEPADDARAIGILRTGTQFEISERREIGGVVWHRMKQRGWVRDSEVRTRKSGPASLAFSPRAPDLASAMPYPIARVVARDGVPVYRRPPRRGEDPQRAFLRKLQEGYFFTVDKWVNIYDRQLYRGTRYWFIPRDGTTTVREPAFEGVAVNASTRFPFLWVTDPTARVCDRPAKPSEPPPTCTPVERHSRLPLLETRSGGGTWYRTEGGWIASLQVARVHELEERPKELYADERWVHVDLRNQFAALYVGDDASFVTLISSGDDEHPTPPGFYRVESKHVTATMDDEDNLSSPYFIQDVPWVVYFKGGYALHGAFWHDRFGLKTSHGCVNLAPRDARRFFEFVDAPELVEGFHAVFTPPGARSTAVYVTN